MFSDADRALLQNALDKNDGHSLRLVLDWQSAQAAKIAGQIAGLSSALTALAAGKPVDLDAVTAAAKAGAQAALDEKIAGADVSLNVTP